MGSPDECGLYSQPPNSANEAVGANPVAACGAPACCEACVDTGGVGNAWLCQPAKDDAAGDVPGATAGKVGKVGKAAAERDRMSSRGLGQTHGAAVGSEASFAPPPSVNAFGFASPNARPGPSAPERPLLRTPVARSISPNCRRRLRISRSSSCDCLPASAASVGPAPGPHGPEASPALMAASPRPPPPDGNVADGGGPAEARQPADVSDRCDGGGAPPWLSSRTAERYEGADELTGWVWSVPQAACAMGSAAIAAAPAGGIGPAAESRLPVRCSSLGKADIAKSASAPPCRYCR
mmetsp:Transcript_25827/g.74375  ORF Transcript_25827/g.74375 Transcript_25827/m.74375 type:complete len:295 (+) Transcript_25827:396-1280(+)